MLIQVGLNLCLSSLKDLADTVPDPQEMTKLRAIAGTIPGVLAVLRFRCRPVGSKIMLGAFNIFIIFINEY